VELLGKIATPLCSVAVWDVKEEVRNAIDLADIAKKLVASVTQG